MPTRQAYDALRDNFARPCMSKDLRACRTVFSFFLAVNFLVFVGPIEVWADICCCKIERFAEPPVSEGRSRRTQLNRLNHVCKICKAFELQEITHLNRFCEGYGEIHLCTDGVKSGSPELEYRQLENKQNDTRLPEEFRNLNLPPLSSDPGAIQRWRELRKIERPQSRPTGRGVGVAQRIDIMERLRKGDPVFCDPLTPEQQKKRTTSPETTQTRAGLPTYMNPYDCANFLSGTFDNACPAYGRQSGFQHHIYNKTKYTVRVTIRMSTNNGSSDRNYTLYPSKKPGAILSLGCAEPNKKFEVVSCIPIGE